MAEAISFEVFDGRKKNPKLRLEADIDGKMTKLDLLEYASSAIIHIAQDTLKEVQKKGFDSDPVIFVDGKFATTESGKIVTKQIEYRAKVDSWEVLDFIARQIQEETKIITGQYANSHVIFFNNQEVARDYMSLKAWAEKTTITDKDVVQFVNIAPYANRLELEGVTKSSTNKKTYTTKYKKKPNITIRKPNGVYQKAYLKARNKYKGVGFISMKTFPGNWFGLVNPAQGSGIGRIRQKGRNAGMPYVYPVIEVYFKSSGIK